GAWTPVDRRSRGRPVRRRRSWLGLLAGGRFAQTARLGPRLTCDLAIVHAGVRIRPPVGVHVNVNQGAARSRVFPPLVDDPIAVFVPFGADQTAALKKIPGIQLSVKARRAVFLDEAPRLIQGNFVDPPVSVEVALDTPQPALLIEKR